MIIWPSFFCFRQDSFCSSFMLECFFTITSYTSSNLENTKQQNLQYDYSVSSVDSTQ